MGNGREKGRERKNFSEKNFFCKKTVEHMANATQEDIAISAIVARIKAMFKEEGSDQ